MFLDLLPASPPADQKLQRTAVFIHIPKAAGSSFTTFIQGHFPQKLSLVNTYWEILRKQPFTSLSKY